MVELVALLSTSTKQKSRSKLRRRAGGLFSTIRSTQLTSAAATQPHDQMSMELALDAVLNSTREWQAREVFIAIPMSDADLHTMQVVLTSPLLQHDSPSTPPLIRPQHAASYEDATTLHSSALRVSGPALIHLCRLANNMSEDTAAARLVGVLPKGTTASAAAVGCATQALTIAIPAHEEHLLLYLITTLEQVVAILRISNLGAAPRQIQECPPASVLQPLLALLEVDEPRLIIAVAMVEMHSALVSLTDLLQHDSPLLRTSVLRLLLAMSHHKQLYTELMTTSGLQGILDLVERERSQMTGFDIPTPFDGTELALALQLLLQLIENEPDRLTLINGHSAVKGLSWSKLLPGVHLPLVEDTVLWTEDDQLNALASTASKVFGPQAAQSPLSGCGWREKLLPTGKRERPQGSRERQRMARFPFDTRKDCLTRTMHGIQKHAIDRHGPNQLKLSEFFSHERMPS
ncbi:MAG: hypothetical protein SGPRY_004479 [Prymnesium sp.]